MKTTFTLGKVDLQKKPGFFLVEKFIGNCDIFKNSYLNDRLHRPGWIPTGAILKATCLMQSQAMTDFQDIDELNSDTIFNQIVGRRISQETLRQRLNQIALQPSVISDIDRSLVTMLRGATFNTVEINGKHYIPLDIDVTPFCNPDVQKEEISCTYKKVDGFAPIMAYLGHFALAFELRPGSQHSENGAIEFLLRCINLIKRLGLNLEDILVRVDSGHDDGDFIKVLEKNHLSYIVKRNFRRASRKPYARFAMQNVKPRISDDESVRMYYYVDQSRKPTSAPDIDGYAVFQITEPYKDAHGYLQYPLYRDMDLNSPRFTYGLDVPCEVEAMWTNLPMSCLDPPSMSRPFAGKDRMQSMSSASF
ncbi:MAG: transposase [Desulfovibrio sp.]|nr:transposase [Desulfovibrio sp.]